MWKLVYLKDEGIDGGGVCTWKMGGFSGRKQTPHSRTSSSATVRSGADDDDDAIIADGVTTAANAD
jgi:hypothetical protein